MEQIHINPFVWEYVLDEMCRERNADIMLYSSLAAAEEMADGIDIAVCAKDGMKLIRAKFAVDASGDACLVRAAGGEFEVIGEPQPSTLQNLCSGYNMAAVSRDGLIAECDAAIRDGKLPAYVNGGQIYNWLQKGSIELHTPAENSHTATGGTETEINARENLMRMYLFLRTVDGLENFYIKYTAASTGIRESVRIIGEKTVTEEEYLAAVKYDDAVCYSFYPIDRHVPDGVEQVFLGDGKVPTVPYGAMIAKGTKRIITAGRCISSDRNAGSALRVQATCMAEGQAAGCAAAVCLRDDTQAKTVDMEKLKKQLRDIGAIVP